MFVSRAQLPASQHSGYWVMSIMSKPEFVYQRIPPREKRGPRSPPWSRPPPPRCPPRARPPPGSCADRGSTGRRPRRAWSAAIVERALARRPAVHELVADHERAGLELRLQRPQAMDRRPVHPTPSSPNVRPAVDAVRRKRALVPVTRHDATSVPSMVPTRTGAEGGPYGVATAPRSCPRGIGTSRSLRGLRSRAGRPDLLLRGGSASAARSSGWSEESRVPRASGPGRARSGSPSMASLGTSGRTAGRRRSPSAPPLAPPRLLIDSFRPAQCSRRRRHTVWRITSRSDRLQGLKQLFFSAAAPGPGLDRHWVHRRVESGFLHRLYRGVYSVGVPHVAARGRYLASVMACGPGAWLSHRSGAALSGLESDPNAVHLEVTVPKNRAGPPGVHVSPHPPLRPAGLHDPRRNSPVTSVARTLLDLSAVVKTT